MIQGALPFASADVTLRKHVATRFPVLPLFVERWSPRSFADRPVEAELLGGLFEAARLAPSAHNCQPARFLVTQKDSSTDAGDAYERLFRCLSEGNKPWAGTAPVLILASVMRMRFSQLKGEFVPYPHCMHDLGLAVMSMLLQAQGVGLHCHPMAGFEPEDARATFGIPPLFEPMMVIAVGYLGDAEALSESLRQREVGPRTRRPLEEIVFEGNWGQPSSLLAGAEST